MIQESERAQRWPGSHSRALFCPYEYEDPSFSRAGRLPNVTYGDQVRAIWVTRYDFHTNIDIIKIMQRSAQSGFNTVFFQVRGNATTYYPSKLEPWSEVYDWQSPGFDPLMLAIREAHSRNMALHAWVNVMPMWRGSSAPTNKNQMYWTHPEWSWYDEDGLRQPLNRGFYVSLNPCIPEARDHVVAVCREIVSCYEVDGLHLDYIRFPNEAPVKCGRAYPRDKRTLELFQADTGFTVEEKPELWDQWRSDSVTTILRDIRRATKSLRPHLVFTAAVGAERKQALSKFQDVRRWCRERLLDAVVPMNYTMCQGTFRNRVESDWLHASKQYFDLSFGKVHIRGQNRRHSKEQPTTYNLTLTDKALSSEPAVVMGTSVEWGDSQLHQKQLALAIRKFGHFSVFSYSTLFEQREEKRQSLLSFLGILASASKSISDSAAKGLHPFRAGDITVHPEEVLWYDQPQMINSVPAGSATSFRNVAVSWRQRRRGKRFTSEIGGTPQYHRRTARRRLLTKERRKQGKEVVIQVKRKELVDDGFSMEAEGEQDIYTFPEMNSWEAARMESATRSEEEWLASNRRDSAASSAFKKTSSVRAVEGESRSDWNGGVMPGSLVDSPMSSKRALDVKPRPPESPLCRISALISPYLHR